MWVKIVLGVIGAGALGGGGYFLWRYAKNRKGSPAENSEAEYIFYRTDFDKMVDDEIKKDPRSREPVVRDEDDKAYGPTDVDKEKLSNAVKDYISDEGKRENFESYLASMESPEEDEDEYEDDDYDDGISRGAEGPYEITAGEFCNTRTYYDKASVNWFMKDDVVSDDHDKVMENADRVLGDLRKLFDEEDFPSVVYIRNEDLEIDYEISLVDGSYRKEVLHLEEEE